jgi:cell division protein FtsI (penicillin-binding protein 3)
MRKMMEGVVLYGTGKQAQLNGYSSGGKTGTAQKIDPATHTYSKSMHVASFAGIAPVNNPVIAVAVVMDNPKGSYYGASVSAPVFAEVAQQVLEYLGVAHDIDVRPPKASKAGKPVTEDDGGEDAANIEALYAAANDLPTDDPLRAASGPAATPGQASTPPAGQAPNPAPNANADASARPGGAAGAAAAAPQPAPQQTAAAVTIDEAKRLRVPSLIGLPVRKVVELAAAAGLEVKISGNGTVREQAPAPGAMVAPGTQIVARCGR